MHESTAPHALEPPPPGSAPSEGAFTALDWIALIVTGNVGVFLLGFPVVAGKRFGAMYADFGAKVPLLTSLVIAGYLPVGAALVVMACLAFSLRARLGAPRRRALVVGAFVAGALAVALCFYGLYLPIWELAGKIQGS